MGDCSTIECPSRCHVDRGRKRSQRSLTNCRNAEYLEYLEHKRFGCSFRPDNYGKGGCTLLSRKYRLNARNRAARPQSMQRGTYDFVVQYRGRRAAQMSMKLVRRRPTSHSPSMQVHGYNCSPSTDGSNSFILVHGYQYYDSLSLRHCLSQSVWLSTRAAASMGKILMIAFHLRCVGFIMATLILLPIVVAQFHAFLSKGLDHSFLSEFLMHTISMESSPANEGLQIFERNWGTSWCSLYLLHAIIPSQRTLCSASWRHSILCGPGWRVDPTMDMIRWSLGSTAVRIIDADIPHTTMPSSTGTSGRKRKATTLLSLLLTDATNISYTLWRSPAGSKLRHSPPTASLPPKPAHKKRPVEEWFYTNLTFIDPNQWLHLLSSFAIAIILSTLRTRCLLTPGELIRTSYYRTQSSMGQPTWPSHVGMRHRPGLVATWFHLWHLVFIFI